MLAPSSTSCFQSKTRWLIPSSHHQDNTHRPDNIHRAARVTPHQANNIHLQEGNNTRHQLIQVLTHFLPSPHTSDQALHPSSHLPDNTHQAAGQGYPPPGQQYPPPGGQQYPPPAYTGIVISLHITSNPALHHSRNHLKNTHLVDNSTHRLHHIPTLLDCSSYRPSETK